MLAPRGIGAGKDGLSRPRREQPMEAGPVERGTGIGLAPWRDVTMAHDVLYRADTTKRTDQPREHRVLRRRVRRRIGALELDAHGKVVASLAPLPCRHSGVPRAIEASDELNERT